MKLFHAPGACSVGIRILLEEAGASYDLVTLSLAKSEQHTAEYRGINPKGKVPALLTDSGRLVTEFPAIAWWIARRYPAAALLPEEVEGEVSALEQVEYIVSSLHMRGYTLAAKPEKFTDVPESQAQLVSHGLGVYKAGLAHIERSLGDKDYMLGRFSIVDAATYYLLSWSGGLSVQLTPQLAAYLDRMESRPSVRSAEKN